MLTIYPHDNWVFIRAAPALKEVEEEVSRLNVDVPRV